MLVCCLADVCDRLRGFVCVSSLLLDTRIKDVLHIKPIQVVKVCLNKKKVCLNRVLLLLRRKMLLGQWKTGEGVGRRL